MIKVNVLYPNGPQATFDFDYYRNTHLPLVAELLGDALLDKHVEMGLDASPGGEKAPISPLARCTLRRLRHFMPL